MAPSSSALKAVEPPDDVDVLEPQGRTVRFGGRDVEVMPMTVGLVPKVTRALRGVRIGDTDASGILELVAEHGDQVLEAAAHATGLALEDVRAAQLPEFVELLAAVLEVNAAFFTQAVTRLLRVIAAAGTSGAGPTSSTDSSTPDTATPT